MRPTLKWNEHIIKKQIKSETEIPDQVTRKTAEAYEMIKRGQVHQSAPIDHRNVAIQWVRWAACSLVLVMAASFMFCMADPVMAKGLPIVGGIFEQLQDKVSFLGNFSDKAASLEGNKSEDGNQAGENLYSKTDGGLTVTLSEIYANDQAVYLTMQLKSEKPFPDMNMFEKNGRNETPLELEYLQKYSFVDYSGEVGEERSYGSSVPEGSLVDDHTYNCILRLDMESDTKDYTEYQKQHKLLEQKVLEELGITMDDINDETEEGNANLEAFNNKVGAAEGNLQSYIKEREIPENFTLSLNFSRFIGTKAEPETWDSGYSKEEIDNMTPEEQMELIKKMPEEYQQHPNTHENFWYDGSWDFEIPVTVDASQTETTELNDVNEGGIGLKSVVKTPYELTFTQLYNENGNSNSILVALDANGNKLPYIDSGSTSTDQFAIQNRDISTVDVYIVDYNEYMDHLKGEEQYNNNENKADKDKWSTLLDANAKYHTTLHF